jgi:hypothetical protein
MTNINLINWTVQEAQHLKNERPEPNDMDETIPSLDAFLAMIESESTKVDERMSAQTDATATFESEIDGVRRPHQALPDNKPVGVTAAAETAPSSLAPILAHAHLEEQPVRVIGSPSSVSVTGIQVAEASHDYPASPRPKLSDSPPVIRVTRSTAPETQNATPEPALLVAIKQMDYRTAAGDRERAIALRWVLRDILGRRLKLSPVSNEDLQTLVAFGLLEMRSDLPTLTEAGLGVIA